MAPIISFLISSGSKKNEPRYVCLREAKASHSHKMWTEVSSSVPHFLHRVPSGVPLPEAPSTEPLQREMFHPQSSLHPSLKVPGRRAFLQVLQTGPLWKDMPGSRASPTYPSRSAAREPSLQVLFTELPQTERERERRSNCRAPFHHISKSPLDEPTLGCQTEPHKEGCPSPEPSFRNLQGP